MSAFRAVRSGPRQRRPTGFAALAVALAVVASGCTGGSSPDPEPESEPAATGTPLAAYDAGAAVVDRSPYCDRISAPGVLAALDGSAADAEAWHNGETARLAEGVNDVAHEFGCRYEREGASAETWLFAPPVTPRRAGQLAKQARGSDGCRPARDAAEFGRSSVALLCEDESGGGAATASYRGLFGDAWLACQVTREDLDPAELLDLAGRWCVEVVEAVRTS